MKLDTDLRAALFGHKKELIEAALVVGATLLITGGVFALANALAEPSCTGPKEIISLIQEPAPIAAENLGWPIEERMDRPADEADEAVATDEEAPRRHRHRGRRS